MNKRKIVSGSIACVLSLGTLLGGVSAAAAPYSEPQTAAVESAVARRYLSLSSVKDKSIYSYAKSAVYVSGKRISASGININGTDYIPLKAAANAIGATYSYNSTSRTAIMRIGTLTLSATNGNYVIYASDRALFALSPAIVMSDGEMYIPASTFAKATGLSLSSGRNISFSGEVKPLAHASRFYREDEVLWLARIIHAESAGEPLLGMIAVGNVVLNRVASKDYPNTIYSVIFDRKYGVQFSPILNGSIYNTPSYNSVLAAKICLEGFDVSGGALFFLRPDISTSSWIPNTREYSFTVGKHDFYK